MMRRKKEKSPTLALINGMKRVPLVWYIIIRIECLISKAGMEAGRQAVVEGGLINITNSAGPS